MLHEQLALATLPNTGTRLYIPWGNFVLPIVPRNCAQKEIRI